jgi:hypothetical protein
VDISRLKAEYTAKRYETSGTPLAAPADGRVVFPNPNAAPGAEWFYFAVPSARRL